MRDMDIDDQYEIELLDDEACWELLLSSSLGRLAMSVGGEPNIYPVSFVAADRKLYLRTAEGSKLLELTVNNRVAFETDGVGREQAWSVVVKGTARILEKRSEIDAAEELPLHPLIPTLKYIFVEITPHEMSGRRFPLGPEPERF
ncbi:MAG: pyridoxamine 5'-phosphate oxidase family protein [Leifsonia sp.]